MSFLSRIRSDKITKSLTDLLDTIKSWCNSLFALDNNTVHKTNDEIIDGVKSFSNTKDANGSTLESRRSVTSVMIRNKDVVRGTQPTDNLKYTYTQLIFGDRDTELEFPHDENNNFIGYGRLSKIEHVDDFNLKRHYLDLATYRFIHDSTTWNNCINFQFGYDEIDSNNIIPFGWFSGSLNLSRTVDASAIADNRPALLIGNRTGIHLELDDNEIIAKATATSASDLYLNNEGGKVYIGPDGIQSGGRVTVHGNVGGCAFYYWARTLDKTIAPSANSNMDLLIGDVNGYDTKYLFARFGVRWQPNRTVVARIAAYKGGVHGTDYGEIGVAYPAASDAYGFAPETPSSPSAITILTYSWIPKDTRIVHRTGNETVGGKKTFSETLILTGNIKKDRDTSVLYVCGGNGNTATNGGLLILCGASDSVNPGKFYLRCQKSSSDSRTLIGYPGGSLTWNGQSVSTSSDERLKTPIEDVNDDILDQWSKVQWGQFKFKDAVAEKGYDDARYHIGLIAQSVDRIFKDNNLDILKYGILCHDEHEAIEAKYDSDGNIEVPAEDAVDLWMVRYTEALCLEAAYQRRKNTQLENKIKTLEEENESLKKRLEILEQAILNK